MRYVRLIPWLALAALAGAAEPSNAPPAATDTATYLGIETSAAPPALREQLGLPRGVGVVVEAVEPDGPAGRAGLAVHDVVTRLDDQLVVNVPQFGVLIRLRHGGETVKLSVVRHGRPVELIATLLERPIPASELAADAGAARDGRLTSVITHTDGEHVITVTTHGRADRHVRIADAAGHTLYDGPLNTPDDAAAMPADCRAKVEAIQRNFERFKRSRATTEPAR